MGGRYFQHFLINRAHTGMVRQQRRDIGRTVSDRPYPLPRRIAEAKAALIAPYLKHLIDFGIVHTRQFQIQDVAADRRRSEEHTSELQSLMRTSYTVFCLKKKTTIQRSNQQIPTNTTTSIQEKQHTEYNTTG